MEGHGLTDEALAKAYCGACHLFPDPGLLSKSVWEDKVLKDMGRRLGIRSADYDPFYQRSMYDAYVLRNAKVYPLDTLISESDWQRIVAYYQEQAPEEVIVQDHQDSVTIGLPHFQTKIYNNLPADPLSTLVKFDTASGSIYWGNRKGEFLEVDANGQVIRQIQMNYGVSAMEQFESQEYILTMGTMDPTEEAVGQLVRYDSGGYKGNLLLPKLHRPVHLAMADMNQDGAIDMVVSQFGDQTGHFSWFEKQDTGYIEHVIKKVPGVIKTEVRDFNDDGRLDIMALMTQGNEGLSIFYQQANGSFKEARIQRFPPVYGSSSFELLDFNGDGALDILYTAGDNADFSYSLKKYHGVRIFINRGENQFEESHFYPMYGAMNAKGGDFDNDGDIDIAVISFFPDLSKSGPQGFVYLENQGDETFKPYTFPEAGNGRWLVMDAADYDQDGDLDLVLGSLLFKIRSAPAEQIERWTSSNYQMILLENSTNQLP